MKYLSVFMKSEGREGAKTRLLTVLPKEEVARLYEAFVQDTLEKLAAFPCDVKLICYLGNPPSEYVFSSTDPIRLRPQQGADLGERMRNFFEWSFSQGAEKSVVIGSDSPTLPLSYLEEAFFVLDRHEVVIGPSLDGGYYLVGMRKFHPELFDHMAWGSSDVLQKTLSQNRHLEGKIALLGPWYDVDTPEALDLLRTHLLELSKTKDKAFPKRTYKVLSEARRL